ncbi:MULTISPECIES: endonuclease/exonuclease/phosphatase family protein [Calothrix]|uniref:Endonuclease/exonuclease/phosphatase family protein n=2 Tax=Calothrix TaxID=1186 RepID=A0ABR8A3N2_9CYAN|nr:MULTISPECIES: endonuclease/exonuclease/phosphatase family protein [Calothrix]MBD2194540.1 endonuclease/exonuclease/phosphatase family protein [Calothrix parietina FACHB-288]MBD2223354.1 endonuclease/exonuclease/phosphatase family protein [Calothrix anomala FACHB-343]
MTQRIILFVATATLLILGFLSLGSYIAWFYPLELVSHFRVHYLILSLIFTAIVGILWKTRHLKSKIIVLAALLLIGLNLIEVLPWYLPHAQQLAGNTTPQIRLLSFNINIQNKDDKNVINVVQDNRPDVALFLEITPNIFNTLKTGLKNTLPFNFRSPGGGLAIFSRLPIQDVKADNFNGKGGHNLIATLTLNQQPIKLIGTHPLVPVTRNNFHRRNLQLAALSDYIREINQPLIIMGDFNLTPWSPYYRRFIKKTNLHNTRLGFGILPSWPRPATHVHLPNWVIPLLNIPIDHCFVSKQFRVAKIYTGSNANSDHAPLITDLVLS